MRGEVAAVLAVHGAGSTAAVFRDWDRHFTVPLVAVDLHAGLDVSRARMEDYAEQVVRAAAARPRPIALVGWSMGGLVVMQAARRMAAEGNTPSALVLIEASAPAEVAGFRPDVTPTDGSFDPEEVYGEFPPGQPARPESTRARGERKRGVSVPSLPCRTLVISGNEFAHERGRLIAAAYGASHNSCPTLSHWQLMTDQKVAAAAAEFLTR